MPSSTTISITSTAPTFDKEEGIEMVNLSDVATTDIEVKGPLPAGMTKQSVKAAFLELVQKTLEKGFDFTNFCRAWVETCAPDGLIALSMTPSTLTGKPERQYVNPLSSSPPVSVERGTLSFANLAVFQISLGHCYLFRARAPLSHAGCTLPGQATSNPGVGV
jgi:hypothetical protein